MAKTVVHKVVPIPGNGVELKPVDVERKDDPLVAAVRPGEFKGRKDFEKVKQHVDGKAEEVLGHISLGTTSKEITTLSKEEQQRELRTAVRKIAEVMIDVFTKDLPELYQEFKTKIDTDKIKSWDVLEREATLLAAKETITGAVSESRLRLLKDGLNTAMRGHKDAEKEVAPMSAEERLYCVKALIRARRIAEFKETPLEQLGVKPGNVRQAEMLQTLYLTDVWGRNHPKASAVDVILATRHTDLGEDQTLDEALNKSQGHERGFPIKKLCDTLELSSIDSGQRKNIPQIAAMIKDALTTALTNEKAPSKTDYRTTQKELVKWVAERLIVMENLNKRVMNEIDPEIRRHEARVITKRVIERILKNERQSENPLQDALEGGIRKMPPKSA